MWIYPLLLLLPFAPLPGPSARVLADFSRFSKVINQEISLVEADGTVREGVLTAANADQISVRFGSDIRTYSRETLLSAERMRDRRIDGAIKGALFGLLLATMASQGLDSSDDVGRYLAGNVASFAAIGYLIDAGNPNRQLLYRALPQATAVKPRTALSLSFRF